MSVTLKTTGQTAMLFGATGAVGRHILTNLLASSQFTRVVEVGRRTNPLDSLKDVRGHEKLVQKVIDFQKIDQSGLKDENADVIVIAMGRTRISDTAENFADADKNVINAALAAKTGSPTQRLVYLSSIGADINARMLYFRSKAQTEHDLAKLGYSDYVVFRPGRLAEAERGQTKFTEHLFGGLVGFLSLFSDSMQIPVKTVAKSIAVAAETGSAGLPSVAEATNAATPAGVPSYFVIHNKGALNMAK